VARSCSADDLTRSVQLWKKYVTDNHKVDWPRLLEVVRHETRIAEKGIVPTTPDLIRELRAERAEVGALAKRCADAFKLELDGARRRRKRKRK
jgi:hypothetical protein